MSEKFKSMRVYGEDKGYTWMDQKKALEILGFPADTNIASLTSAQIEKAYGNAKSIPKNQIGHASKDVIDARNSLLEAIKHFDKEREGSK